MEMLQFKNYNIFKILILFPTGLWLGGSGLSGLMDGFWVSTGLPLEEGLACTGPWPGLYFCKPVQVSPLALSDPGPGSHPCPLLRVSK